VVGQGSRGRGRGPGARGPTSGPSRQRDTTAQCRWSSKFRGGRFGQPVDHRSCATSGLLHDVAYRSWASDATSRRISRGTPSPRVPKAVPAPRRERGVGFAHGGIGPSGASQVAAGVALIVVNYIDYSGSSLLPGGHQEAYFVLGILVAASSIWWFGWFDRQPSPEQIRAAYDRTRSPASKDRSDTARPSPSGRSSGRPASRAGRRTKR